MINCNASSNNPNGRKKKKKSTLIIVGMQFIKQWVRILMSHQPHRVTSMHHTFKLHTFTSSKYNSPNHKCSLESDDNIGDHVVIVKAKLATSATPH